MKVYSKLSRKKHVIYRWPLQCVVVLLAAVVFFGNTPAADGAKDNNAATTAGEKGLHIEADGQTVIDIKQSSIEYSVNVRITQGTTRISADNVKVFYKKNTETGLSMNPTDVEKIIATGNVNIVSKNGAATAREAVYDAAAATLVLTGEPATLSVVSDNWDSSSPVIKWIGFTL